MGFGRLVLEVSDFQTSDSSARLQRAFLRCPEAGSTQPDPSSDCPDTLRRFRIAAYWTWMDSNHLLAAQVSFTLLENRSVQFAQRSGNCPDRQLRVAIHAASPRKNPCRIDVTSPARVETGLNPIILIVSRPMCYVHGNKPISVYSISRVVSRAGPR